MLRTNFKQKLKKGLGSVLCCSLLLAMQPALSQIASRINGNGGFEFPDLDVTCGAAGSDTFRFLNDQIVPNWDTDAVPNPMVPVDCGTTPGRGIEFWESGFFGVTSDTGFQHIELNGTEPGRVFQEVCLLENEAISYSYFHRSRNAGTETTRTVIFDETGVINIATGPNDNATDNTLWIEHTGSISNDGTTIARELGIEVVTPTTLLGNFIDTVRWDIAPLIELVETVPAGGGMDEDTIGSVNLIPLQISGTLDNPATFTLTVAAASTASATSDFTIAVGALDRGTVDSFDAVTGEIQVTIPAGDYDPNVTAGGAGANQGVINIQVTIVADTTPEPTETLAYDLSAVTTGGGNNVARDLMINDASCNGAAVTTTDTLTILNDDGADISVTKTLDSTGPFTVLDTIQYTIVVSNAGPNDATMIMVTDTPSNLTITSVSSTNCTAFPCTIPTLTPSASETITVMATIDASPFDNSVTVTSAVADPDTTNNTDDTGNGGTAGMSADLSVTKTLDTAGPFVGGDTIQYTIVVANAGPNTATSVSVTDTPTNLTINSVSSTNCTAFPCTIPNLASGTSETITVMATIGLTGGAFDNSVTVSSAVTDPVTGNNTDNTGNGGTAGAVTDLSVDKVLISTGPFFSGDFVNYTITVDNMGPSVANNVMVTDTPDNLAIVSVTSTSCTAFPCTIPTLAVSATEVIAVEAQILGPGAFDNGASVVSDEADSDTTNNDDANGNGATADARVVPSLSVWGMLLMILVLLAFAYRPAQALIRK